MCQSIHSAVTDLLFPKKKDDTPQLPTFEGDSDEVIFLSIPIQKFFLFILLYIDEEYVNMETQGQEIIPEVAMPIKVSWTIILSSQTKKFKWATTYFHYMDQKYQRNVRKNSEKKIFLPY